MKTEYSSQTIHLARTSSPVASYGSVILVVWIAMLRSAVVGWSRSSHRTLLDLQRTLYDERIRRHSSIGSIPAAPGPLLFDDACRSRRRSNKGRRTGRRRSDPQESADGKRPERAVQPGQSQQEIDRDRFEES